MATLLKRGIPCTVPDEQVETILKMFPNVWSRPTRVAIYDNIVADNTDELMLLPITKLRSYASSLGIKYTCNVKKELMVADILSLKNKLANGEKMPEKVLPESLRGEKGLKETFS